VFKKNAKISKTKCKTYTLAHLCSVVAFARIFRQA